MTETVSNNSSIQKGKEVNALFPVFLKLENLRVLLIGAGNVALEKLRAIINNSPGTQVYVVAEDISDEFEYYASQYPNVKVLNASYNPGFIDDCDLVIAAVNDVALASLIRNDAHEKGKLINVADKPELCDFYLSSIVTKGNLKIAISTNGKSPTMAKRLKEVFNDMLPEEIDDVIENLQQIRDQLKGDFQTKVHELNKITESLVTKPMTDAEKYEQYWFL